MQTIDRKILIVAAVALIDVDGRILISKRPDNKYLGGLWEFPGGKLENNEKAEDALIRELEEELNIYTWKSCLAPLTFSTFCLLYTSPSPRDLSTSRMPSSA